MLCRTRSSLARVLVNSRTTTTTSHGSITCGARRSLGSRSRRPRTAARRAALAIDRRMEKAAKKDGNKSAPDDAGEQLLSESGMRWGFFFSLGVLGSFGGLLGSIGPFLPRPGPPFFFFTAYKTNLTELPHPMHTRTNSTATCL